MRFARILTVSAITVALLGACGRVEPTTPPEGAAPGGTAAPVAEGAAPTAVGAAPATTGAAPAAPTKLDESQIITTPSGLKYADLTTGSGAEATPGKQVSVHYTGWLTNGTKFDSSLDRGEPFTLQLGSGSVIKGWDEGLVGMKVGGKRQLIIPPELGYGDADQGVIPPKSTLIFEVELVDVK